MSARVGVAAEVEREPTSLSLSVSSVKWDNENFGVPGCDVTGLAVCGQGSRPVLGT